MKLEMKFVKIGICNIHMKRMSYNSNRVENEKEIIFSHAFESSL